MRTMFFTQAIDDALAQAMADDPRIIVFGEDIQLVRRNLLVRFGPKRVVSTPISEAAFLGAGVAAAMTGLRPVVDIYMVDFLGVCMDVRNFFLPNPPWCTNKFCINQNIEQNMC
jgi:pyruvate dehydrogenase E1 component beta subunit